jgi:hypothetical protein
MNADANINASRNAGHNTVIWIALFGYAAMIGILWVATNG